MALTDNLVSAWLNNDASGGCTDSHGSNTLSQTGTVGATTGILSGCRGLFTNPSDYFNIASNSDVSCGDVDFTFAVWFKTNANDAQHAVSKKTVGSSTGYYLGISNSGTGHCWLLVGNGSDLFTISSSSNGYHDNNWHLLIAWHDATNNQLGISVDGGAANTTSHSTGVATTTQEFVIGGNKNYEDNSIPARWKGYLDQVLFWKNRVLTSQDRTDLYNGGAGLAYPFTTPKGMILPRRHRRVSNLVRM